MLGLGAGGGVEAADGVEVFSPVAGGDDFLLDHGELEGIAGEGGFEIGFEAASHAFEHEQVGGGRVGVNLVGNVPEVDQGGGAAGIDGEEAALLDEGLEERIDGLEARKERLDLINGHIIEGGEAVGGEDDAGAPLSEQAAEGHDAEDEIGPRIVAEKEHLAVAGGAGGSGGEEGIGKGVEVVDEPGAPAAQVMADLEEVRGFMGEHAGGGASAQVEDVAGEDALHGEKKALARIGVRIQLGHDAGIQREGGIVFPGLGFPEGIGKAVGDELILPELVEHKQIEGVDTARIGTDGVKQGDEFGPAGVDASGGAGPIILQGEPEDGFEMMFEVIEPVLAVLVIDVHVLGGTGDVGGGMGQEGEGGHGVLGSEGENGDR